MVCRLRPAADSASGTGKMTGGHGGRPNMVDLAAGVKRITGAMESFEAEDRRGWPSQTSASTVQGITGPWIRLRQTSAVVGQARLPSKDSPGRRHGAIGGEDPD